jgi:ComF family protein
MSFLFPATCVLCNNLSRRKLNLCIACENELPFIKNQEYSISSYLSPALSVFNRKIIATFYYQHPIKKLILGLKFNNNLVNAKILGILLSDHLSNYYQNQPKPEIIIPVPLHPARLKERGYNQALELARPVAKKMQIKIDKFAVTRTKNTAAQALLSPNKRADNIKQAFKVNQSKIKQYKFVAIIDDVITTGNTLNELCKTLEQNGINQIDIWCCAKACL